ncbi:hypothetical protein GGI21_002185 [Coemansia aciculifera]|uniref:Uncharacterized protein n=1 Tax=Coemansia aciculifera TaxID=417176 RepID=A0ACC1MA80_9FUNG|nr:hypothetical protein IWW38_000210 [Coemansia aciculifera]KAJ2909137.1 hypothetical protein GGI21_002185 [Coemansia aciculifera]
MGAKSPQQSSVKSSGILGDIVNSIFEPGVNRGVLIVMNGAFAGLFLILTYLLFATHFNIHVCALTLIAAGLFASIQWFIQEATAAKNKTAVSATLEQSQRSSMTGGKAAASKAQKKKKL